MGKIDSLVVMLLLVFVAQTVCGSIINIPKVECEQYDDRNCSRSPAQCKSVVETCKIDSDKSPSCYVLWSTDPATAEVKITMKGCFTDSHECNQTQCVSTAEPRNNMNFCCCKGSLCNSDYKWIPTSTEATTQVPKEKTSDENFLYVMLAIVILVVLIGIFIAGLFVYKKRKQGMFNEIPSIEAEVTSSSPCLAVRPIELLELKARGRFGDVWQGRLRNDVDVAVKIFSMQEKDSWNTEIEIYKLPRMKHPNVLEFLGGEKHLEKMKPELWLITVYHTNGSLCDYLKAHTLTWAELCKIAESMARGLMHLHEEILPTKTEGLKPAIAHRDFKSKNVLLKSDLTACVADFGLAMIFQPGKSCGDTHGQVGTRRYMAPEVLEGAINFNRDAFLRIDVYACGLVLWEMVSRCDVNGPAAEYALPFEAELGQRPSLEEVQDKVVGKKLRPRILDSWRLHPGLSVICDTMEECWDHDAEARLSSSCVMERFTQFNKYPQMPLLIETNSDTTIKDTTNCL